MAYIILPSRWRRQPVGSVGIDWSHWAASSLRHLWLFSADRNWRADLVTGTTISNAGSFGGIELGGLYALGNSGGGSYWSATLPSSIAVPVTILAGIRRTAGTVNWCFGQSGAWTGWYGQNTNVDLISTNSASFDGSIAPTSAVSDDPFGIVYSAYTMRGANDLRGSSNGGQIASDTSCVAPAGTHTLVRFGADFFGTNFSDVYVRLFGIWGRSFSNPELHDLSRAPWQLVRPLQRRIWVSTGAAGGPITGTSAGTFSLTGTAAGQVLIAGSSTQSFTLAATGAAAVEVAGSSAAAFDFTGTAEGVVGAAPATGTSVGSFDLTGSGVAEVLISASSAASITLTGTGEAAVEVAGSSSAVFDFTGAGDGVVSASGIPVLSAATVINITTTSATPRVTLTF